MSDRNQQERVELGQNIMAAFRYIREVFIETVQLITILDDLMGADWQPPSSDAITEGLSRDLKRPTDWLVKAIFRFYHRIDEPGARKGITVVYLDRHTDQPILIGGRIDHPADQIAGPDDPRHRWDLRKAWFEKGPEGKKADGTLYRVRLDEPDSEVTGAEAQVFAVPLVSIQSEDDIRTKVYDELMKL